MANAPVLGHGGSYVTIFTSLSLSLFNLVVVRVAVNAPRRHRATGVTLAQRYFTDLLRARLNFLI
jgi:hypothetical protein